MTRARVAFVLLLGFCSVVLMSCEEEQNATQPSSVLNEPDFATPEYIVPCSRKDPKIDSCFQNTLIHLRPYLVKGIPELELPPIEPLVIPEMKIENGQGPVRVRAIFTNITAIGPGNFSISKIRINMASYRIDIHISFPKIELQGNYDINGNILLFPIQSHGQFWALLGDVAAIARVQGVEEVKDGVRYLTIGKLLIDFKLGRIRFRVTDHLNGDNVIGQAMNQFLNQNAHEIVEELKPAASASIGKHFKDFLNIAFSKIPLKVWMHDT
ncbi:PREDICTED: protein takeout-like [Dinoponera quadriceps]|uniref:Protein takeout-like n=1 Tax=Dinoponera quadriceps TaxID=609295 RepID=A0A6P3WZC1_DINQU|nr:PREDICTED: protein takeout-like [Dinoponera quadriceps]